MSEDIAKKLLVTPEEAKADIQLRIDALKEANVDQAGLLRWYDETEKTLEHVFVSGGSNYFYMNSGFNISENYTTGRRTVVDSNLPRANGILRRLIALIDQYHRPEEALKDAEKEIKPGLNNRVFVVHGHDEKRLLEVKEILKSQNLLPIILKDEPNGGATVIEKFEKNSDVGFAVVLFTADDIGSAKSNPDNLFPRARQNVVLELGYFIGRLTRARICALNESGVELPSDIHGVVYTALDSGGAWRYKLLDELKHAGFVVDKNKL